VPSQAAANGRLRHARFPERQHVSVRTEFETGGLANGPVLVEV
jgi:hypothetical protein